MIPKKEIKLLQNILFPTISCFVAIIAVLVSIVQCSIMSDANTIARQSIAKVTSEMSTPPNGNLQENITRIAQLAEENHKKSVMIDGIAGFIDEMLMTDRRPANTDLSPFIGRHVEMEDGYGKIEVTILLRNGNTVIRIDDTSDRMNSVYFIYYVELGVLKIEDIGHGGIYRYYYVNHQYTRMQFSMEKNLVEYFRDAKSMMLLRLDKLARVGERDLFDAIYKVL